MDDQYSLNPLADLTQRPTPLGELVETIRKRIGLTQEELGALMGEYFDPPRPFSRNAISDIERGKTTDPHQSTLEAFSYAVTIAARDHASPSVRDGYVGMDTLLAATRLARAGGVTGDPLLNQFNAWVLSLPEWAQIIVRAQVAQIMQNTDTFLSKIYRE